MLDKPKGQFYFAKGDHAYSGVFPNVVNLLLLTDKGSYQ